MAAVSPFLVRTPPAQGLLAGLCLLGLTATPCAALAAPQAASSASVAAPAPAESRARAAAAAASEAAGRPRPLDADPESGEHFVLRALCAYARDQGLAYILVEAIPSDTSRYRLRFFASDPSDTEGFGSSLRGSWQLVSPPQCEGRAR